MAIILKAGFWDYLMQLPIAKTSKDNYRQYARWIEKYGVGELDIPTLQDETKLASFIDVLGDNFDADKRVIRQHRFNPYRKGDAKTVLRHYLSFLQSSDVEIEATQAKLDGAGEFNVSDEQEGKERVLRSIALRRGQPKFRAELLRAYSGNCAVTGTAIPDILEAAHIIPYSGTSTNRVSNGLLLRSDIHALFDLRLLSIDPTNMQVYCSKQIRSEPMYSSLNGQKITIPKETSQQPDRAALKSHFENRVI